jgi:hypothetical protein
MAQTFTSGTGTTSSGTYISSYTPSFTVPNLTSTKKTINKLYNLNNKQNDTKRKSTRISR